MIIDAWAQHPTLRHSQDPIFDSLRRWTKSKALSEPLPVAATLAAMDEGCVAPPACSGFRKGAARRDRAAD